MSARRLSVRRRLVALALAVGAATTIQAPARASGYAAEIKILDLVERRLTLKASMGELTVRVASGVSLERFKPGDKVLITFGLDGSETVITHLEPMKP